jgi:hypothetical protein
MAFKPVVAPATSSSSSSSSSAAAGADAKLAYGSSEGLVRAMHSESGGDAAYQEKLKAAMRAEQARQKALDGAQPDEPTLANLSSSKKGKPKYTGTTTTPTTRFVASIEQWSDFVVVPCVTAHYDTPAPNEADMEAYRMLKVHADDPMAKFLKG